MANKMVKRDYFTALRGFIEANPEVHFSTEKHPDIPIGDMLAFVDNELTLLASKSGTIKKPTEKQTQNEVYKTAILNYLREVAPEHKSIAEIWDGVEVLSTNPDMTGQRISALITQLKNDNLIVRIEEKRKAYFKAA